MTKKEKAVLIVNELEKLYPVTPIPLSHSDAFTLLVAVVLSAQCTDERVNKVTPKLFSKANTPLAMSTMDASEIETIIRPCGLAPAKSKNINSLSKIILEKHNGVVPSSFSELENLPGVGHKTASVVMSQAFGVAAFPVDTHIHRLMTRWKLTNGKNVVQTERDAKKLFDESLWNKLHLQIIYYGREYSPARGNNPEKDFITTLVNGKVFTKKQTIH